MSELTPIEAWRHARIFCIVCASLMACGCGFFLYLFFKCNEWKP